MKQEPLEKVIDPHLAELLYNGATKAQLHAILGELLNADPDSPEVDVARMNTVGTARAWGYVVSGGRGGGLIYKVIGWQDKPEYRGSDDWEGAERRILDTIHEMPAPDWARVKQEMTKGTRAPHHTRSSEYIRCYELAKGHSAYDCGNMLVLQKFASMPRLRIYDLDATAEGLWDMAQYVAQASLGTVEIRGIDLETAKLLKQLDPKGWISRRAEAVYDVPRIANHPELYLNKRAMTSLRKMEREVAYTWLPKYDENSARILQTEGREVIDLWRNTNERKMRQLAITRDYTSLDGLATFNFIGYRQGHPVCLNILDRLPAVPDCVALITEKSLNYSHMPGGHSGISDFNIVETCRMLANAEVKRFNAGGYDGGGLGLADHKKTWSDPELDVESITFITSLEHLSKEKYRV